MRSQILNNHFESIVSYAASVTQLDGAALVVGLHLKHPNSVVQLLGH